jgi:UDP-N-acetylglucosamine transferase subunit ALG13
MTDTRNRALHIPAQAVPADVASRALAVLVVVGTDVHRFDRLMDWLETWHASRPDRPRMIVQHGGSRAPALPGATPFLAHDRLTEAMARARVVVTHGGPASIAEARRHGHVPIVVARDPAYAEHVDDHQQLFAARLANLGAIRLCTSAAELGAALDRGLAEPAAGPAAGAESDADAGSAAEADARAAAVARVGRIVDDLVAGRGRRASGRRR